MPSFTILPNASVQAGGRPRGSTVTALRDNPIAIAEGFNAGAPIVAAGWHPYNRTVVGGSQTGLIYDFAVTGAVAEVVTPDFVDGYEYRIRLEQVSGANVAQLRMELYRTTDAAYGAALNLTPASQAAASAQTGLIDLPFVRRVVRAQPALGWTVDDTTFPGSAVGNNNVSISCTNTAQKRERARIYWSTGNIDGGKIFLDRRTAHY